jgi:hypothetical protein
MGPIGHFGIAFAVKPLAPKAPLWSLLVASEALDLLSAGTIALGLDKRAVSRVDFVNGVQTLVPGSVPYSHGLFMALVWSLLAGGIASLALRDRKAGGLIGLVVFSHWILDFIVHEPDLPILFDASHALGLGLWTSGPGFIVSMILEFILLGGGVMIYIAYRRKESQ